MNADIETMDADKSKCLLKDKEAMLTEIEDGMGSDEHRRLIERMEAMLERADEPKLERNCCIYKAPQRMRERNPIAYTPKMVSIGPLHHGNKKFKPMEELKLRYLKSYLKRSKLQLGQCIAKLKRNEKYIRSFYAETISRGSNDFVKMILIDACFIIEYFFRCIESQNPSCDDDWNISDPILSKPSRVADMMWDLILLENQLPFRVFDDLFTRTCRTRNGTLSSFLEVSFFYLCSFYQQQHRVFDRLKNVESPFESFCEEYLKKRGLNGECEEVKVQHLTDFLRILFLPCNELGSEEECEKGEGQHLTDFLRICVLPCGKLRSPRKEKFVLKYSASQLVEAGLKFKVGQNKSLIEVRFEKGVLTMPQLLVDYNTETLLRNVAAFEQCHCPCDGAIIMYVVILDLLINECKDVDILVEKGVLVNMLGESNKVVTIFNDICMGMVGDHPYYIELSKNLNHFYEKPRHKHKAIFIRDYLSTPWKVASFGAAIVLLLLTLVQTICSIISLH